jgi:hypothetical protein
MQYNFRYNVKLPPPPPPKLPNQIHSLDEIIKAISHQHLDVCVISFGGSSSNTLVDVLEQNGITCKTPIWQSILCHCPYILPGVKTPIIYLYRDLKLAFLSCKQRMTGIWDINQQKLSNNLTVELSDERLLVLMLTQFVKWTNYITVYKPRNIRVVKYEELFQSDIKSKLESFLGKPLDGFPITYIPPKSASVIPTDEEEKLFIKYKPWIDYVNRYAYKP